MGVQILIKTYIMYLLKQALNDSYMFRIADQGSSSEQRAMLVALLNGVLPYHSPIQTQLQCRVW